VAKVLIIMGREKNVILPSVQRLLAELGENIRLARLRRRFSAMMVAERAGIARNTLRAIERGDANVKFSAYVNVLFVLGLEKDLRLIAQDDELGRKLQDANLPTRARAPRIKSNNKHTKKQSYE
jgi:transcriptional regulator with XRE-family HTH domain